MPDRAAIVPKPAVETALDAIKRQHCYDDCRRIEEYDEHRVAIPVTEAIDHDVIDRVETGVATTLRTRTLADQLRARGWSDAAIAQVPRSYAVIGSIVVLEERPPERAPEVGEALLSLHGGADTVLVQRHIEGQYRRPRVEHLAGERRTRTVHTEHGIAYEVDLGVTMFSPGNQHERVRMAAVTESGERVLDLCAGIGYFTLPLASAGATVTAIEHSPAAVAILSRNTTRNGVADRVRPICGDCRATPVTADRVVVGHLPVHDCRDDPTSFGGGYLDAALRALEGDGWLHVHGISWADEHELAKAALSARLRRRGERIETTTVRQVKSIAERTDHVVVDVRVRNEV